MLGVDGGQIGLHHTPETGRRVLEPAGFDIDQAIEVAGGQSLGIVRLDVRIGSCGLVELAGAMQFGGAFEQRLQGLGPQRLQALALARAAGLCSVHQLTGWPSPAGETFHIHASGSSYRGGAAMREGDRAARVVRTEDNQGQRQSEDCVRK